MVENPGIMNTSSTPDLSNRTFIQRYQQLLRPWVKQAIEESYTPPQHPEHLIYGTGFGHWGIQTQQKAFAATAVLAACTDDKSEQSFLLEAARRMLRYQIDTHHSGPLLGTDGLHWGRSWISALGIERMMHGIEAFEPFMEEADREGWKRVMLDEGNWLLDSYYRAAPDEPGVIKTGLVKHNDPESNIWNGLLLLRTAMLYPDAPRAAEYEEKGTHFLLNGISVAEDAQSDQIFAGRPLREWHIGPNFYPSFALHHHHYLNVGYMVICLSNLAMGYFAWKRKGLQPPESLDLHAYDLWKVVKMMTFPDGRLCRIGGDSRARYCYCQDYAIPTWLWMADRYGESHCLEFESRWLDIMEKETAASGGKHYLRARLEPMAKVSPTYYTRLESDRACAYSMALWWRHQSLFEPGKNASQAPVCGSWTDDYHGAAFIRENTRITSFVWRAAEPPQALCLPPQCSDLAEWRWNLCGRLEGTGARNVHNPDKFSVQSFPGGFLTAGVGQLVSEQQLAEGEAPRAIVNQHLLFAALPDATSSLCIHVSISRHRCFLSKIKGVFAQVPNDIFNNGIRHYYTADRSWKLKGPATEAERIELNSNWVNVEDRIGIHLLDTRQSLVINRPAGRQVTIRDKAIAISSLYVDEICSPCHEGLYGFDSEQIILDHSYLVQSGVTRQQSQETAMTLNAHHSIHGQIRIVSVRGADGRHYSAALNLQEKPQTVQLTPPAEAKGSRFQLLAGGEILSPNEYQLPPYGGLLGVWLDERKS